MQKQVFTGLIYTEFYTPCQHFRNLVSSWEVGKTTCVKQVVKKAVMFHSARLLKCAAHDVEISAVFCSPFNSSSYFFVVFIGSAGYFPRDKSLMKI